MTEANHRIVRDFFIALGRGELPDELLAPDMTVWTTTGGAVSKDRYQGGVRLLGMICQGGGLAYTIHALTAEEDRVAAEVRGSGTLVNGEPFENAYAFFFRIRDGRIASVAEHFDPGPVQERLAPLMRAATGKAG